MSPRSAYLCSIFSSIMASSLRSLRTRQHLLFFPHRNKVNEFLHTTRAGRIFCGHRFHVKASTRSSGCQVPWADQQSSLIATAVLSLLPTVIYPPVGSYISRPQTCTGRFQTLTSILELKSCKTGPFDYKMRPLLSICKSRQIPRWRLET